MKLQTCRDIAGLTLLASLAACGGGPSESEYVQACLQSSPPGITEKQCACAARESRKVASADQYKAMVLNMQGKKRDADALLGNMSFEERAEAGIKQMQAVFGCIEGG